MLVVIPTCGESEYLVPLAKQLVDEGHDVRIICNNAGRLSCWSKLQAYGANMEQWDGHTNIYDVWNYGIRLAQFSRAHVAILNDDIQIGVNTTRQIERALSGGDWAVIGWDYWHPNHHSLDRVRSVQGSYRQQGVGGFAFACHWARVKEIQGGYSWWGGDDELFKTAMKDGHPIGIAVGCGVTHHTSTSTNARPETLRDVGNDRQILFSRWGEAW